MSDRRSSPAPLPKYFQEAKWPGASPGGIGQWAEPSGARRGQDSREGGVRGGGFFPRPRSLGRAGQLQMAASGGFVLR